MDKICATCKYYKGKELKDMRPFRECLRDKSSVQKFKKPSNTCSNWSENKGNKQLDKKS